jgi:hypothetical protein
MSRRHLKSVRARIGYTQPSGFAAAAVAKNGDAGNLVDATPSTNLADTLSFSIMMNILISITM